MEKFKQNHDVLDYDDAGIWEGGGEGKGGGNRGRCRGNVLDYDDA